MGPENSLDKDKALKSLDKLFDIFKEISFNADEIFKSRCPYKNAKSRCTAKFECKNQHYIKKLNYGIGIIVKNVIYKYDTYFSIEFRKNCYLAICILKIIL